MICEKVFLKNRALASAGLDFSGLGGGSWELKSLKIGPKMTSTWEAILALRLDRFCLILGSKLGRKMEPKSIKKGIEKSIENLNDS